MAYSTDGGKTWCKYAGNPVIGHIAADNRDPKAIWHAPTERWIMAIYLDKSDYTLFSSSDLRNWERICDIEVPGASECPDIFELPVDGDTGNTRWVFWGASGNYLIGNFDGREFDLETGPHRFQYGTAYAAQTWSDIPDDDGRRIQIAWLRGDKNRMPFNQQMTFPCELQLRTTPEGVRMFSEPVSEIENLRTVDHDLGERNITSGQTVRLGEFGELFDVIVRFEVPESCQDGAFGFRIRGILIQIDLGAGKLICGNETAPITVRDNTVSLRVLADRSSIEVFFDSGARTIAINMEPEIDSSGIELYSEGCQVDAKDIVVYEIESIWF